MKQLRILYVCLFAAALVFAYFNGGIVPYMLLYSVILLPFISLAYTIVVYYRFKYEQHLDKVIVTKGDFINFTLCIRNDDFFIYPYIRVVFYGEDSVFAGQMQNCGFPVKPFSKKTLHFKLKCNYRGYFDIGIKTIEIADFFGLFTLRRHIKEPKHITVYPRIIKLDRFEMKNDYVSESQAVLNNKDEDMTTISDVRKYEYGDSLRRIHWKLTAKSGNIMVKKFQCTSETNAVIMLDLRKNSGIDGDRVVLEDDIIESAVSVMYYCLNNWIPVNLVFYSDKLYNVYAKNHMMFNDLYDILARVKFDGTIHLKDLLELYTNNTLTRTNILLFTSNLDYELYNQIYKTISTSLDISVIFASSADEAKTHYEEARILESLSEIGVKCYHIENGDDIKTILEADGGSYEYKEYHQVNS